MPPKRFSNSSPCLPSNAGTPSLLELETAEKGLQRKLMLLQRRKRRATKFVADVAFILFVWTVPDTTLCSAYLESQLQEYEGSGLTVEELQRRYLAASVDQINAISDRNKCVGVWKLQTAANFQRDAALAHWIETENTVKGNAPTAALVQSHLSKEVVLPLKDGPALLPRAPSKVSSKWVQRFRKRCHFTRGRFGARGRLPLDAVREKASDKKITGDPQKFFPPLKTTGLASVCVCCQPTIVSFSSHRAKRGRAKFKLCGPKCTTTRMGKNIFTVVAPFATRPSTKRGPFLGPHTSGNTHYDPPSWCR